MKKGDDFHVFWFLKNTFSLSSFGEFLLHDTWGTESRSENEIMWKSAISLPWMVGLKVPNEHSSAFFVDLRVMFGHSHHVEQSYKKITIWEERPLSCVWERMGLVGGFESDTESAWYVPC